MYTGDPGVGKTSVLLRYLRNQFSPLYIPTKKVAIGMLLYYILSVKNVIFSVNCNKLGYNKVSVIVSIFSIYQPFFILIVCKTLTLNS